MPSPTFNRALHDIGINGLGYVLPPDGRVMRQDAVSAASRAAQGEGTYDLFQADSFYAQATSAGGAGQARLSSTDSYKSGVCDSRWGGHLFPARKLLSVSAGGTTSFMFHRGAIVYGFSGTIIDQFDSALTYAAGPAPRHQPIVDGNDYMFYVSTSNTLWKWTGTGAATNITASLGPGVTPYVVANYHRYLWCLGTRINTATPANVQYNTTSGNSTTFGYHWKKRPVSGNLLIMAITVFDDSYIEAVPDGWILGEAETAFSTLQQYVYYKAAEPNEDLGGQLRFFDPVTSAASNTVAVVNISEWEGMDPSAILDVSSASTTGSTSTSASSGSVTTTEPDTLVLFFPAVNATTNSGISTATGYTELVEKGQTTTSGKRAALQYKVKTSTSGSESPSSTVASGTALGMVLAFKGNTITSDVTQFTTLYSSDAGATWNLAFSDMGTGVEPPTAAHAAGGSLWFTTPRGLYQMGVEDEEFVDGHTKVSVFLRGKIDTFNYPSGASNIGVWLTDWNGGLYYAVGQTLRSFPIGAQGVAQGRQVWPTPDWGATGGNIGGVIAGEGGVYFGSNGILWCFNEKGFHPLATNATASTYDNLYWHNARLYVKTALASYYDFGYPSLRPDVFSSSSTTFETSYWVSSLIDFEKVDVFKHLAQFQTMARFSAASGSGVLTLAYLNADTIPVAMTGKGGETGQAWGTIGTHTNADGNIKVYNPAVIKAKGIYLRLTWTVGASGFVIPLAVVANGRSIMPAVKRFVAPIWLTSDARDKAGTQMYSGTSAVWTAIDELNDIRNGNDTFTLTLVEPDGGSTAYTCTAEQLQDSILKFKKGSRAVAGDAQFVALQLPGTTVTEVR